MEIGEEHFYTSALATAKFIASQKPHASAYVIGAPGLVGALYEAGIVMNDVDPDYVIAGETNTYNYQTILKAVDLINKGARLIATNSGSSPHPDGKCSRRAPERCPDRFRCRQRCRCPCGRRS